MNLKYFSSTDSGINILISSCPWLHTLRLIYFEGISCLRIHAQALKNLEVEGNFEDFHLHAPYLSHLYLTFDKTEPQQSVAAVGDKKNYLKQAFGNQTNIEEITISGSFLTYLSKGCLLIEPPGVFGFLRKICIVKCLWNWTEVLGACSIFQNAPNFRELEIWSFPHQEDFKGKTIWDQDQTKIEEPNMHYLVTVTIKGFAGLEYEVDLVGLLLRWSPSLEELKIFRVKDHNDDDDDEDEDEDDEDNECICKVLTKLLALLRASNKAKITVI